MLKLLRFVLWVLGLIWHLGLVICNCLGFGAVGGGGCLRLTLELNRVEELTPRPYFLPLRSVTPLLFHYGSSEYIMVSVGDAVVQSSDGSVSPSRSTQA